MDLTYWSLQDREREREIESLCLQERNVRIIRKVLRHGADLAEKNQDDLRLVSVYSSLITVLQVVQAHICHTELQLITSA
jgi:hypothetical protein